MDDREDKLIQLSALQHFLFCERQCYLIHAEQIWQDNLFTAEGNVLHERVDEQKLRSQGGDVRIEYGLLMRSLRLGLSGKADVVEFRRQEDGAWRPYPVEYKRGKPKENRCDEVQLCAQAMCLEEMLGVKIPEGALFYGKTHHRKDVTFDEELRKITEETCYKTIKLLEKKTAPPAIYEKEKCTSCSLMDICLPKITGKNVSEYLSSMSSLSSLSSTNKDLV